MAISREYCYVFFVLRKELLQFFQTEDHECQKILENENFILYLAYLSDICGVMNHFSHYLQRPESNIIDFEATVAAFISKAQFVVKEHREQTAWNVQDFSISWRET